VNSTGAGGDGAAPERPQEGPQVAEYIVTLKSDAASRSRGRMAPVSRAERARLAGLARGVMAGEGCRPGAELSVALGDDRWIQELNRKYRGRGAPTDVLAFPQDLAPPGANPPLGDVAISVETAERQAKEFGHGVLAELALLVAHGILHLTGWSDRTPLQRRAMMRRAATLLAEILPDLPLQGRRPRRGRAYRELGASRALGPAAGRSHRAPLA